MLKKILPILIFLLAACGASLPEVSAAPIYIEYTFATQPWLMDVNACVAKTSRRVVIPEQRASGYSSHQADFSLRIGEPSETNLNAYPIDTEEISVIVNPENPLSQLTLTDLYSIFSGQIKDWSMVGGSELAIQVWVFGASEDLQRFFNIAIMQGQTITSQAHLAAGPEEMRAAVSANPGAIGILTRHWTNSEVRPIELQAETIDLLFAPILALVPTEQDEDILALITCLQED